MSVPGRKISTERTLVPPNLSQTGIYISTEKHYDRLIAVSNCCNVQVYNGIAAGIPGKDASAHWGCPECHLPLIKQSDIPSIHSSVLNVYGVTLEQVTEWVSSWTGIPVGHVQVTIT